MSPRDYLKKLLPSRDHIQTHSSFKWLGERLHDPNLWHISRHSAAGGVAIGVFCAFIPFPVQIIFSVLLAIYFKVNVPITFLTTFISNPFTMPPIFFFCYKFGSWLLQQPYENLKFQFTIDWLLTTIAQIWQPLFLGCFILGSISAAISYYIVINLWRFTIIRKWEERRNRRKQS